MTVLGRRRLLGLSVIGVAMALGGAWLARVDYSQKISTDVLDLLPAGERSPEVNLVRALASEAEARVMLFVLTDANGAPAPPAAAHRFAAELASRPEFQEALVLDDNSPRDAIGRTLFEKRLTLLFPLWLAERKEQFAATGYAPAQFSTWLARDASARLGRFLSTPEALPYQDALPSDPLLLLPDAFGRVRGGLALVEPANDTKVAAPARVWARIAASPLSAEGQEPVFEAIRQAEVASRVGFPGLSVAYTGVNRFAAASRERIRHELEWLNALSVAAVLAVVLVFISGSPPRPEPGPARAYRRARRMGVRDHGLLPHPHSRLRRGLAAHRGRDRLRILPVHAGARSTRGGLLGQGSPIEEAPFLQLLHHGRRVCPPALFRPPARQAARTLRGGRAPLRARSRNRLFPTRRQVHVPYPQGGFPGVRELQIGTRRVIRRALVVAWLAVLPGLFMVKWKDDIRELEIPSPTMQSEDARIRALFSGTSEPAVYLTQGQNLSEARDALVRFDGWLRATGKNTEFTNLGAVIPTDAEHADALRFAREHPEFPAQLRSELAAAGFEADGFSPFFDSYATFSGKASDSDLDAAVHSLASSLSGPLSLLVHDGRQLAWFVTLASPAPAEAPPAATQTVGVDQLQTLNRIFERYRQSALRLSLIGLAIVGMGVLASYGLRDGVRIFSIPCGVALGFFGLCGWLGIPLNLFHLLGAFLGVCLTHNYSIFTVTSAYMRQPPPASVRLSALCTAASFGVLALSAIPVVHALGETVALMVLAALFVIEFEHFAPISTKR